MSKDKGRLPPVDIFPEDLTLLPEDKATSDKKGPRQENKLGVPANSPTLTVGNDLQLWVKNELIKQLDNPDYCKELTGKVPGLKGIKPRPNFRLDDKDPKENPRDVYVFEFEDANNVYMNKKDGSLWCAVDPNNEPAMNQAVDRMLGIANKMGMNNGTLCLPSCISEGMRERLTERVKATAERLGMNVNVIFGDPRIPPAPRPYQGPPTPPIGPRPGPALVPPGAAR